MVSTKIIKREVYSVLVKNWISKVSNQESINFFLTNKIPRALLTNLMGRYSRIRNPWLTKASIYLWQLFSDDLKLHEAKTKKYNSLHQCFTRELKDGARRVDEDPESIVSPCDAVVGAFGDIQETEMFQIKGSPYKLEDLVGSSADAEKYRNGKFVTLRLKSSFYHRFHAPYDCSLSDLIYISGDTWNVNPIALKRIERLFCKNERAVLDLQLPDSDRYLVLVPVAAILVASMKLHCLDEPLNLKYKGPNRLPCNASYKKGEEIGYFEHGSTIVLIASQGFSFKEDIREGNIIQMGTPLLRFD